MGGERVKMVIAILDKIIIIMLGCLIGIEILLSHEIVEFYKVLKSNPKIYAINKRKVNIKLVRGIGMLFLLIALIIFAYNKLRIDYFVCIVVLLSVQILRDLLWGINREKLTEIGVFARDGVKDFYWIEGFSWSENINATNDTVTLQINMGTNEKILEFDILKDKKAEIDEFLKQNSKYDTKK